MHIPGTNQNSGITAENTRNSTSTQSTGKTLNNNTSSINNTSSSSTSSSNPLHETKQKISSFLGRDGQADTTVHETINPAVEHEHISKAQREERQKIIDREIHQDHHHTTVQPIVDREVAPTTHTNRVEGVETREIQHGNDAKIRANLEAERSQFRSTQDVAPTVVTEQQGPTVAGEHIHHHVHENIQPVIERDIHQEHVIHTTKPVHEIHQNESIHHTASTLPPVDVSTFKSQGGNLAGRQERVDAFQGAPKPIDRDGNRILGGPGAQGSTTVTGNEGSSSSSKINQSSMGQTTMRGGNNGNTSTTGTGMSGNAMSTSSTNNTSGGRINESEFDHKAGISRAANGNNTSSTGSGSTAQGIAGTSGVGGASTGMAGGATSGTTGMKNAAGNKGIGNNNSSSSGSGSGKKGSLVDKLNPAKDSTGSGNPGFMH